MDYPVSDAANNLLNGKFTDGNPSGGIPASLDPSSWANLVTDELLNILAPSGVAPSETVNNQIATAIQSGLLNYATDTGEAGAYVGVYNPAITVLTDYLILGLKALNANPGASTLSVYGDPYPVVGLNGSALQGGEISAGGQCTFMWSVALGSFILLRCVGGALQIPPATKSEHAMQLGQATGRLLRTSVYTNVAGTLYVSVNGAAPTTVGAGTWSALAATNSIDYEGCGASGSSGGTAATGSTTVAIGNSSASGSWGRGYLTSGFSAAQTITVGVGGAAQGNGAAGVAGGTTSFGTLATWPSSAGGAAGSAFTPPNIIGNAGAAAVPTGCNIYASGGQVGGLGLAQTTAVIVSGTGGSTPYGAGGPSVSSNTNGNSGSGFGSGASGPSSGASDGARPGSAGSNGFLTVREFA